MGGTILLWFRHVLHYTLMNFPGLSSTLTGSYSQIVLYCFKESAAAKV